MRKQLELHPTNNFSAYFRDKSTTAIFITHYHGDIRPYMVNILQIDGSYYCYTFKTKDDAMKEYERNIIRK